MSKTLPPNPLGPHIRDLWNSGLGCSEIARRLNVSVGVVANQVYPPRNRRKLTRPPGPQVKDTIDVAWARDLLELGMSLPDTAETLGCSLSGLCKALGRERIRELASTVLSQ